jgi:hypothetical protein
MGISCQELRIPDNFFDFLEGYGDSFMVSGIPIGFFDFLSGFAISYKLF